MENNNSTATTFVNSTEHATTFGARRIEELARRNSIFAACRSHGGTTHRVTREERSQARAEMADRLEGYLNVADRDNYYWVGSQRDLLELAYEAWLYGSVRDPQGRPIAFAALARRVCAKLHMPLPCNVYATAAKARQRKGVASDTLLNRYCFLRFVRGNDDPLADEVVRLSV